jgi:hypothetical protein
VAKREVDAIYSADGFRKVVIFERDDGSFGFESWHFSDDPEELTWIPDGPVGESFCETQETAEREARGRVWWLSESR